MCKAIYDMRQEEREAGRAEGRAEGREEGRAGAIAEAVLTFLGELQGKVPEELRGIIMNEKDAETLKRYLKLAASAGSVEEFVSRMS